MDKKISQLTALTGANTAADDVLAIVDTNAAETKKIRADELFKSLSAGTAAAPAITPAGDQNTGIFFPAADTIAFSEGGVESMRIDSSGNVGLGVTPSAWQSSTKAVQLTGGSVAGLSATDFRLYGNAYENAGSKYVTTNAASMYRLSANQHIWYNAPSGTANNAITWTQVMTLDSSGRLLVGSTAKETYGGNVVEFSGANIATPGANDTGNLTIFTTNNQAANIGAVLSLGGRYSGSTVYAFGAIAARKSNSTTGNAEGYLQFYTTDSGNAIVERMRIDSSGNLLVGVTSGTDHIISKTGGYALQVLQSGQNNNVLLIAGTSTSSSQNFVVFAQGGSTRGTISTDGSTTSYNTSSDYRLKENIAPMTGALDTVAKLNPVTYTWKSNGSAGQGFIAHELQAVVPDAVTGEKDAVDEEGNAVYQGVDTSFLVATLTAAIQELKAEVDALKAQINQGA